MGQVKGTKIKLRREWMGNKAGAVLFIQYVYARDLVKRGVAEMVKETAEVTSNVDNMSLDGKMVAKPPKNKMIKLLFNK